MAEAPSPASARPDSPYKGLIPYEEGDAAYFFGRDAERETIVSNLLASRLTVLSGESGVGKTSVLRAGVLHELRRQARLSLTEDGRLGYVAVDFAAWNDDPLEGIAHAVERSVRLLLGDRTPEPPPPTSRLDELLDAWSERLDADLLLILDQFEDYFLYHRDEHGEGTFEAEFPKAVARRDLRANFLLSVREDAALKLDRFKLRLPTILGNRLAIRPLDRRAAEEAIRGPIAEYDSAVPAEERVSIEGALVEAVLDEVGSVRVGTAGEATVGSGRTADGRIEMPYLQLVMVRLWEAERAAGSHVLRQTTLEQLGGAGSIVATHVEAVVGALPDDQQAVAAEVFGFLVTPEMGKIAVSPGYLSENSGLTTAEIEPVLRALARKEASILRPIDTLSGERRYEIYHDALAPHVLEWRRSFRERRERMAAEVRLREEAESRVAQARLRTRQRAARAFVGLLLVVGVVLAAVATIAIGNADRANREAAAARTAEAAASQALQEAQSLREAAVAQARSGAEVELAVEGGDPQRSLAHAITAWDILDQAGVADRAAAEVAVRLALSHASLERVIPHSAAVWTAAFSPDGAHVVTASQDRNAQVVDTSTGQSIPLSPQSDEVLTAAFSPDGSIVVTTTLDKLVKAWDADTGRLRWTVVGQELAMTDGYDADGRYLATGAFSADSRWVVTRNGSTATIRDLQTGDVVRELRDPSDAAIDSVAFSPDGLHVVTATEDGVARTWNATTGAPEHELDNETDWVNAAVYSPDGTLVGCANSDGSIGIFDAATGSLLAFSADHETETTSVAFSPDSRRAASVGGKEAVILDVTSARAERQLTLVATIRPGASWIDSAEFSPDGSSVVAAYQDGTARIASATAGDELVALRGHDNIVWTARFSPTGDRVVTASEDGTARVWRVGTQQLSLQHGDTVNATAFSPDGGRIATATTGGNGAIWDAATGARLQDLPGADFSIAWNDAGDALLSTQTDKSVGRWSIGDSQPTTCCSDANADNYATSVAFVPRHPDRAVVLYQDGSIGLWDLGAAPAGERVASVAADDVTAVVPSPDGTAILIVRRFDRAVRFVSSDTLEEQGPSFDLPLASSVGYSPDGRSIITANYDGTVRVWDAISGAEVDPGLVLSLRPAISRAAVATFSRDGSLVLAGTTDGTVRIWDADARTLLADVRAHAGSINSIDTFGERGSLQILSGSDDGSAHISSCAYCGTFDEVLPLARAQLDIWNPEAPAP